MSDFQSTPILPEKQCLEWTDMIQLEFNEAEIIKSLLDDIGQYPNQAVQKPMPKGRQKSMIYLMLTSIFGGD